MQLKWSYAPPDGDVQGPPVVANGKVYFGVEREDGPYSLYALDAATGGFVWKFPGVTAFYSPAAASDLIYVSATFGPLYALDANTGAVVWQNADQSTYSPTLVNGVVYVYSPGPFAGIAALNAQMGAPIWRHLTNATVNFSPTVADGVLYYNSGTGTVDALDANTGALLWEKQLGATLTVQYGLRGNELGQSLANGVLYVGVRSLGFSGLANAKLYALNASTGAIIWFDKVDLQGTPAVANGIVYVTAATLPPRVLSFNSSTGAPVWEYQDTDELTSGMAPSPIVANGVVYVGSWRGLGTGVISYTLSALDAGNGMLLWNRTGGTSEYLRIPTPAVVNGVIYGSINTPVDGIGAFGLPN